MADPRSDFAINLQGTFAVLEALRRRGGAVPLLFASTNKVYGDLADVALERDCAALVSGAILAFGRIDCLVNNAGNQRDKKFAKMSLDDFRLVVEVHLMGAVNCTKAVWETMRSRNYGRIVMTTSSSGLYGNFGQSNYGAAKMALVGLMQTLALEGAKNDIRVNCLAPTAATRTQSAHWGSAMRQGAAYRRI